MGQASGSDRVALYARVSTNDQSCAMQLADLRGLASARGFQATEYVDEGISGAKDRRPALDQLMADCRRGRIKVVMVWRFDRFARSTRHLVTALDEFNTLGVGFISFKEAVDTSTPAGKMLFTVIAAMAEFEREIIRERVRAGIANARSNGVKFGRPKVDVDVERVKSLRTEGVSLRAIAVELGVSKDVVHRAVKESV